MPIFPLLLVCLFGVLAVLGCVSLVRVAADYDRQLAEDHFDILA